MPSVNIVNSENEVVEQITLKDEIFNVPMNQYVVQEVVRMQAALKRRGTASTKTRKEVRKSGRKLYRQKGTGRARSGSLRSPLKVGGGVIFGPHPRNYGFKPPKKVRKAALRMVLSEKLNSGNLLVLQDFDIEKISTKEVLPKFLEINGNKSSLVILPDNRKKIGKSIRNSPLIDVLPVEGLNVTDVLRHEKVIFFQPCIQRVEERLSS